MRNVAVLLGLLVVAGCVTDPGAPQIDVGPERYRLEVGASPVGVIPEATLRDAARGRDVEMNIEYPTRGENNPLIVFSHGFGGSSVSYVGLSSYWTSHGYVVIKPTHADSRRLSRGTLAEEGPERWRDRVRDVTFILDSLPALQEKYPELAGKIDASRIGVGGHSYGALTAMMLGGVQTFPGPVAYRDARVDAVVAMSPQGPTERWGLTQQSWSPVNVPTLYMTGTLDRGIEATEDPAWRQQAFELAPEGDQWLVVIEGARHASFTGRLDDVWEEEVERQRRESISSQTIPQPRETDRLQRSGRIVEREREIFATARSLSLAFWDAYLRGDAQGRQALESTQSAMVKRK
jgi:predicted dienelactone hydrolase